jgi:hypothetical protein
MCGFARPAGGRRRIAGPLCTALATLAVVCPPAAAQVGELPDSVKLPVEDGAVRDVVPGDVVEDTVDDIVNQPLPEPVEELVRESPVAPVREEVRRMVNQTTGSGGPGGDGGSGAIGSGAGAGGSAGAGSGTGAGTGSPGGSTGSDGRGRRGDQPARSRDGRTGARSRQRRGGTDLARARGDAVGGAESSRGSERSGSSRGRAEPEARERGSAAVRTIETIVKAVPTPIWIALGVLLVMALGLGARTFVERRRARELGADRDQLLHDLEALERALLPAVPEQIGAVSASVAYLPCDGPAAGGDFYDVFELPGGRAAVLVGDVSGHGPEALQGTNSVRSQLHALLETGMSPRAAIATVGDRAPDDFDDRLTTVVVAVHDPAAGTLTYATAGHPPPIFAGPGAEAPLAAGASPPIGAGRTGLRQTTVSLPLGSVACMYTDGLVEARAGEGMLGRARLVEMVESLAPDEPADSLLQRVVAAADEAPDDMAVCLVRPFVGANARSPRVEVLELERDDIESGFAERFLGICDVPAAEAAATIERARAAVEAGGRVLLEVRIEDGVGQAEIALAGTPRRPPPSEHAAIGVRHADEGRGSAAPL